MRRWLASLLLSVAALVHGPAVMAQPTSGPLDEVALANLGYQDAMLRGRLVSTDYFIPGPGSYLLDDDNWLDLHYRPSDLLSDRSVMTVFWNGIPLQDASLEPTSDLATLVVRVPRERIQPEVNRLQLQAALQLNNEDCVEENPARHLTIFNTTDVRYAYLDRQPSPTGVTPDLARYPAPFFLPNDPQPAGVRLVVPAEPSSAELTAAARVAAQLGQFAAGRGVPLDLVRDAQLDAGDLASQHLVFIGRAARLPSLRALSDPPSGLRRAEGGGYLDGSGQPLTPGTGIVFEVPSPWNPARAALAVTGPDDLAVERAGTVVSGREGIRALHGQLALVADVQPSAAAAVTAAATAMRLADLGRSDDTVSGVGEHAISFSIEAASLGGRASVPFDLVISHSPLLDRVRSSIRVVLNGVPLASTSFRDLTPSRARARIELPTAALKPGPNTVSVEIALSLPRLDDQLCARIPTEQAWAVLHADSALVPGDAPSGTDEVSLASYPYPFVRGGRLDETVLVVPDDLGDGTAFARLVADLGRATRAALLTPRVIRASEFDPPVVGESDLILWGLPEANPLLAQLGGRLPIQVDDSGQRLVLSRDLTLVMRDSSRLGVVQEVPSPWSAGRSVLVVSATGAGELSLAVDALRRGQLTGNAALASRASPSVPVAGQSPTPEPLVLGGPPPQPLQVSTFRLRPQVEAPSAPSARRPPYVLYAAGAMGGLAVLIALGMAARAFGPGHR